MLKFMPFALFLTFILFNFQEEVLAQENSMDICSDYKELQDSSLREILKKENDKILYKSSDEKLIVKRSDAILYHLDTLFERTKENAENLRWKLARVAIYNAQIEKKKYYQLLPGINTSEVENKLNQCLLTRSGLSFNASFNKFLLEEADRGLELSIIKNESYKKLQDQYSFWKTDHKLKKSLYEYFLLDHLVASFYVDFLLNERAKLKKNYEQQLHLLKSKKYLSSYPYNSEDSSLDEKKKILESSYLKSKYDLSKELYKLMQSYPLLLDVKASTERNYNEHIIDVLHKKIVPSKIQLEITSYIPKSLLNEIQSYIYDSSFEKFINNIKYIDNEIKKINSELLKNKIIYNLVYKAAEMHVNEVNKLSLELCEDAKPDLHLNPILVNKTFELSQYSSNPKLSVIKDQAAYCYLTENEPMEELNKWTYASTGGAVAAAGAIGLSVFGGPPGWISTLFFGSAIGFGYDKYSSYIYSNELLQDMWMLELSGVSDFDRLSLYSNSSDHALVSSGLQLGSFMLGTVISSRIIQLSRSKSIRNYKVEEREVGPDLIVSINRAAKNKQLIDDYDVVGLRNLYKERHRFQEKKFEAWSDKEKFLYRDKTDDLKSLNENPYSTYLFFKQAENGNFFDHIKKITKWNKSKKDEIDESIKIVNEKLKSYRKSVNEIDQIITEGVQAKAQFDELKKFVKGGPSEISAQKFREITKGSKNLGLKLPYWNENKKKFVFKKKYFENRARLNNYYQELYSSYRALLPKFGYYEMSNASKLHSSMQKKVLLFKEFKYARQELTHLDSLNKEQKQLLKKLNYVLNDKKLKPMGEKIRQFEVKEYRRELVDLVTPTRLKKYLFRKVNGVMDDESKMFIQRSGSTIKSIAGKYLIFFGIPVGASGISINYFNSHLQQGWFAEWKAKKEIDGIKTNRSYNENYSEAEINCAKEGRYLMFEICFANLVSTELELLRIKALSGNKLNFLEHIKARQIADKLAYRMTKKWLEMYSPQIYYLAKTKLNENLERHVVRQIVEIVKNKYPNDPYIDSKIYALWATDSESDRETILDELKSEHGEALFKLILSALENRVESNELIKQSGTIPIELVRELKGISARDSQIQELQSFADLEQMSKHSLHSIIMQLLESNKLDNENLLLKYNEDFKN